KAASDEVVYDGAEAGLDDVAAHSPEDGFARTFCGMNGGEKVTKIVSGKDMREGVEKFLFGRVWRGRLREIANGALAFAGSVRGGGEVGELERGDRVGGQEQ